MCDVITFPIVVLNTYNTSVAVASYNQYLRRILFLEVLQLFVKAKFNTGPKIEVLQPLEVVTFFVKPGPAYQVTY